MPLARRTRSICRNSFHSVTIATASASCAASYGSFANVTPCGNLALAFSMAIGSKTVIFAPLSIRAAMISIDGASRISSVSGLKASPKIAIVFPLSVVKWWTILSTKLFLASIFTSCTDLRSLKSYLYSPAIAISAFTSFGKQLPP